MGDVDITKLSLEDRISHKVWKARVSGYEELTKLFKRIDNESSSEYNKYLGSLKKFVIDSNAVAQEKGLEAVFTFVECAAPSISGRVAGDVVAGVVTKCLNARPKTKQKGIDIVMMYLEIEKQEVVQEEVMKGLENKQPKIVASCVSVLREAISAFGGKIFPLKPVVKTLPKLFDHSDKTVREETKALAVEIYKWIKDAIKTPLQNIKPVQLKELEDEWQNLPPSPPVPTRLTRTQQKKLAAQQAQGITPTETQVDGGNEVTQAPQTVEIDPYEMMESVDVLSKIPKDFYENLENKKWQMRKEALESLEKIVNSPKLEGGQYGELMTALKKIIAKDSNVMIVAVAGRVVALLATGLRKKFTSYAGMITPAILEKFKEKKAMVVTALRDAIDAAFLTTTLSAMQEDVLAALDSKNPNVKEETVKFLVRSFAKCNKEMVPKAVLKPLCSSLMKRMDDTVGTVRDAAAEALGTLMKVVGERPLNPYLDQLDKIKMEKVKECSEKAEIKGAPTAPAPASSSSKVVSSSTTSVAKPPAKKPEATTQQKKPSGGGAKPPSAKGPPKKKAAGGGKPAGGAKKTKGAGNSYADDQKEPQEQEMTDEQVDERAQVLLPGEVLTQLSNANWKERLAGIESMTKLVSDMDAKTLETQVLIRVLAKKPGWKDTNFQVLKGKFALCGQIAEMSKPFSKRSTFYALSGLVDKIGDIKLKDQCKETLTIFAEAISLNYISLKVAKNAGSQKNPKVIAESLNWLAGAIKDFGFKIDLKPHIEYIKSALANTNPAVRTAAISLLGTIHMYVGSTIRVFFEEEKPALLQQIDAEIEKVKGEKPPIATRGVAPKGDDEEDGQKGDGDDASSSVPEPAVNLADLVPRNDISGDIKDDLIRDLGDKNWKVRGEALQKVTDIINAAKFITPSLGELPGALKARLGDSNKNLVTISLNICGAIATAMGPQVAKHLKTIGPGIFSTLADAKTGVRAAGISTLNAWHKEIGLAPFIEAEVVFGALSTENPNLRTEVLGWLEEKLPQERKLPREEMVQLIAPLYACLEDRSGDVRKKAQSVVPLIMQHVGWDAMSKQVNKLKPASKTAVQAILEKHRGTVPEKSSSKAAPPKAAGGVAKDKAVPESASNTTSTGGSGGGAKKQKSSSSKQAKPTKKSSQNTVEDEGPPLLKNNEKDRRIKDENSLKVMKWNFSSPRGEYVDQLKDQMRSCVSSEMLNKLFHQDFKFHLKALTTLTECVSGDDPPYQTEATQSLDLLLKWVTLRFFDTNTTVLIKTLEFLLALFTMLSQSDYQMLEHEASSFIPYFVNKVGDPKDVIRKMIRNIFKLITKVYPASKMFNYVMEGISSKNAKTRTECLEELGCLIQVYGMNVCQPTPPKAISAIASQIGDRDNSVRNAALNAIVEAYVLVGDTVYKYCGRLSDKDLGYLEERIKRSNKTRPATAPSEGRAKVTVPTNDVPVVSTAKKQAANTQQARPATAPSKRQENVRREFELDYDQIEDGAGDHSLSLPTLVANDVDDLMSQPPVQLPQTSKGATSPYLGVFSRTNASAALDYVISQIASSDIKASTQALVQLEMVIKHKTQGEILRHVDQFIIAASLQLRMMFTTHMTSDKVSDSDVIRLSNCLVNALLTLFSGPSFAQSVSCDVLKDLIQVLISALLDDKLVQLEDGPQIIRTINVLMVKIVENTNNTVSLGALVKLLQESVGSHTSSPKFVELVMKCLWKKVRMLPSTVNDLNLSQSLLDIHNFLKEHPHQVWKTRADNTPLRTIKTILHSLAKLKGKDILKHLDLIDDPQASETSAYLHKVLKVSGHLPLSNSSSRPSTTNSETEDGKKTLNSPTPDLLLGVQGTPKKTTTKMNDVLAEIFRKIGSKENTRVGLVELYDFKQKYPDADIDPFLKRSSQFFRNYIQRGLQNIEVERKGMTISGSGNTNSAITAERSNPTAPSGEDVSSYRDRLKVLRMRFGLDENVNSGAVKTEETTEKVSPSGKSPTEDQPPTLYDSKSALSPIVSAETPQTSAETVQLDDIMKRLAKIKKQARQ